MARVVEGFVVPCPAGTCTPSSSDARGRKADGISLNQGPDVLSSAGNCSQTHGKGA